MIRPLHAALLLACAACCTCFAAVAEFRPDLAALQAVPRSELPAPAVRLALAQPVKERPYQFAVPVPLALSHADGLWLWQGETLVWRLRLHSEGAQSLSLHLSRPTLPPGSTLRIYDPRAARLHGPYRAAQVRGSGLWTPLVAGDELVVEIRVPAAEADQVQLGEAQVFHGFRDWQAGGKAAAGSCNIDITCPQAQAWTQDGASVARISIGGAYVCSGQLINNVRQDQRRLFLTANHCGVDEAGGPADSVIFYFGYDGACGDNTADPVPPPTFQGSRRLAHDVESDFTLLEITDPRPLPANLYFAGWDATGRGSSSGASIHHPSGGEKKISFYDTPTAQGSANVGTGCPVDAWAVHWSGGTTEAGSSGGGLWDASHRLIGVLSGGLASCENPNGVDYFARLDRGWTARPDPGSQLKAHLDPDGTCVAVVPGLAPGTLPPPGPVAPTADNVVCKGPVSLCPGRHRGGGSFDRSVLLVLLALFGLRLAPHHQKHSGNRGR